MSAQAGAAERRGAEGPPRVSAPKRPARTREETA